jgi:hypothetical protein
MQGTILKIDQNVSRNFQAAKLFSIIIVVIGHYFREFELLWIPVTVGLIIFSFSSSYFTYSKYKGNYDVNIFWLSKAKRLGTKLVVINVFLLLLAWINGRSGIWTWQTVVNILGMNGFLNWFKIQNPSPLGRGMWFFTLLLVFYLIYPSLEYLNRERIISYLFSTFFVVIAFYLDRHMMIGHALWLTASGFVVGIFFARNTVKISGSLSFMAFIVCSIMMFYFNKYLEIKSYNYYFILFLGTICALFLIVAKLPSTLFRGLSFFSDCILEVYLIHPYLVYRKTRYVFIDFIIYLLLVMVTAKVLQLVSSEINWRIGFEYKRKGSLETYKKSQRLEVGE